VPFGSISETLSVMHKPFIVSELPPPAARPRAKVSPRPGAARLALVPRDR